MFSSIATAGIGMARAVGRLLGNELDVIIDEHEITLEMINPDSEEGEERAWDDQHFYQGNLHLKGIANPVKPKLPQETEFGENDKEPEWIFSEKYKNYMENKLMRDIVNEGKDDGFLNLTTATLIIMAAQTFFTAFLWLAL